MNKRVKITTLRAILDIIFPCYCRECGKIGASFCERCILYNIKKNPPFFTKKDKDFRKIYACGLRVGMLSDMIIEYKFFSRRDYAISMAWMLNRTISMFSGGEKYVVVPLPTISKHIRSRGFDHIRYLADEFMILSSFLVCPILKRKKASVQVGASARERIKQASEAYEMDINVKVERGTHFLLLDDVWTTGASMRAAAKVLREGLKQIGFSETEIKISAIVLAKNDGYDFN